MVVSRILLISRCLGTVSKAFDMSMAAMRVLSAGFFLLKPSRMFCVMFVSVVTVECRGLNPCCEGSSGMCSLILSITRRSRSFDVQHRSEIGRYEAGSLGSLFGFRMGMILAVFHKLGKKFSRMQSLKKFVKNLIA